MNLLRPIFLMLFGIMFICAAGKGLAQSDGGISGNFQLDAQTYKEDSLIGAEPIAEKMRSNGFLNLNFTKGAFSTGLRYEMYLKELNGFDKNLGGENGQTGITYRYAKYSTEDYEITVGNTYEQFGNGLIYRTYEERGLGLDNSLDGAKIKLTPIKGLQVIGLIGRQRTFFNLGAGIVRGGDIDLGLNDFLENFGQGILPSTFQLRVGASVVSKFQKDSDPLLKLPENVLGYATRLAMSFGDFSFNTEYAFKYNDPSAANNSTYNNGKALLLSGSYSTRGLGINVSMKSIDNMDFRSDRSAILTNLPINYLPAIAKNYTYRLLTLYPYATQNNGEIGIQGDLFYTFEKGTLLGGKYGTMITLNYSKVHGLDTTQIDEFTYNSEFLKFGKRKYFEDMGIEISKSWSKELKTNIGFMRQYFNKDVVQTPGYGLIRQNIIVAEIAYTFAPKQTLRMELQHLSASHVDIDKQGNELTDSTGAAALPNLDANNGNWLYGLLEYTIAPSWFFSAFCEWNYGNYYDGTKGDKPDLRLVYPSGNVIWVHDALRVQLGYGRIRGGVLCVGGVCRTVPASNGFSLSISSSF